MDQKINLLLIIILIINLLLVIGCNNFTYKMDKNFITYKTNIMQSSNEIITNISILIDNPNQKKLIFKIGSKLPNNIRKVPTKNNVLINSSDWSKAHLIIYNGIQYYIGFNNDNIITYIDSKDRNFNTPDGITMNNTLKEILIISKRKKIDFEGGWASYIALKSGWHVAFKTINEYTKEIQNLNIKPKFIFKRLDNSKARIYQSFIWKDNKLVKE